MKILQLSKFYPPYKGGIELVAKMISKSHIDLGDQVDIVSFGETNKTYTGPFGEVVLQIKTQLTLMSTPMNFTQIFNIISLAIKNRYQVIYIHLPNPMMHEIGRFIKLMAPQVKIIAIYHSDIINQKFFKEIYNAYFVATSSSYDKLVVSSENLWKYSTTLKHIDEDKKFVIPFCTDENRSYKLREKASQKFLAIGRMVPYKGFNLLIDAFKNINAELRIIGKGPQYDELLRHAPSNVKLLGSVSEQEKEDLLYESDYLVMSSLNQSEAYGMILVEALEVGLPIIFPNIRSGVTYLGCDQKRGFIFESGDKNSLITAINKAIILTKNRERYNQISKNCRTFFDENLSYVSFKDKIQSLSRSL